MKNFDDISDAFDYCREANKPVVVIVNGKIWKLFPSGFAKPIESRKTASQDRF